MSTTTAPFQVRPIEPADFPAVVAINEASLPAVSSLTVAALSDLVATGVVTLVACSPDGPIGVLVCLDHEAEYDSRNFEWLK